MEDPDGLGEEEEGGLLLKPQESVSEIDFKILQFKDFLSNNDAKSLMKVFETSNLRKISTMKVPMEALFLDWQIDEAICYGGA